MCDTISRLALFDVQIDILSVILYVSDTISATASCYNDLLYLSILCNISILVIIMTISDFFPFNVDAMFVHDILQLVCKFSRKGH